MFEHIMVPVDMDAKERQNRATHVACDLGRQYETRITLISISGGLSAVSEHTAKEYEEQLARYAEDLSSEHGVKVEARNIPAHDPSVDVDRHLREAVDTLGADLVVMASHIPGWPEYIVASHGGKLAAHAPVSVMLVRDPAAA